MEDLAASVKNLRKKYREIFKISAEEIQKRIDEIKPDGAGDIFDNYPANSPGMLWQKSVLKMFDEDICRGLQVWPQLVEKVRKPGYVRFRRRL